MASDMVRLELNAAYDNGVPLFENQEVVADSLISESKPSGIRVVTLRFALADTKAQQLLNAFRKGNAELSIDGVPVLV